MTVGIRGDYIFKVSRMTVGATRRYSYDSKKKGGGLSRKKEVSKHVRQKNSTFLKRVKSIKDPFEKVEKLILRGCYTKIGGVVGGE